MARPMPREAPVTSAVCTLPSLRSLIGAPPAPGTALRPPRGPRAGLGRPGARPANATTPPANGLTQDVSLQDSLRIGQRRRIVDGAGDQLAVDALGHARQHPAGAAFDHVRDTAP